MKTVLCHGVFDILHAGHLDYFRAAKKHGDKLIVSITTDRFVNKGPGRPYFGHERRKQMLEALSIIDEVIISDEPTGIGSIKRTKPDFYVKGPDYKDLARDVTGEILNEKAAVEAYGGTLVFTEDETFSSGAIINKFFAPWTDAQRAAIDEIKALGGIQQVAQAIEGIRNLKVLVVGEPILDIYRFVNPEGISSKSPSISARFQYEEIYHGGSIAIRNHLVDFCKATSLHTPNKEIPQKIRYISGSQRIFEVTHIDDRPLPNPEFFCDKMLELSKENDLVLLADFGHGLFEGDVLHACEDINTFIGLNVQTNSSNYGFNVYTKHNRYDYLCIDTKEARLAEHDRYSDPLTLGEEVHCFKDGSVTSLTVGPNGSYMYHGQPIRRYHSPAFSDSVIDATGAGDAYFAITAALLKTGCHEALIPFIGNVFAGLKTKIIGNKSSVSKASLLKACAGILK